MTFLHLSVKSFSKTDISLRKTPYYEKKNHEDNIKLFNLSFQDNKVTPSHLNPCEIHTTPLEEGRVCSLRLTN